MLSAWITSFVLNQAVSMAMPKLPQHPWGVYMTSYTMSSESRRNGILEQLKSANGGMIVFDIQEANGRLAFKSEIPLSKELDMSGKTLGSKENVRELVKHFHQNGIYVAARFVLFKQGHLASQKSEWNLRFKGTNHGTRMWLDPSHPDLRKYLIDVSKEIADLGVDEIQYDYVRFPEGSGGSEVAYEPLEKNKTREQIMADFVKMAAQELHTLNVKLGIDVFGSIVWNKGFDGRIIGQNVSELSAYADVLYPMVYPSHFEPGYAGHKNPGDEPYFFVNETIKMFQKEMKGHRAILRPWLQAFPYRVSNFNKHYVDEQVRALKDLEIIEYALWSPGNRYTDLY